MLLELKNYLKEERGYNVKNFPAEIYGVRFETGFENHEGESVYVRVIPESFFKVETNPTVYAIEAALKEMNRLVEQSKYKYHFYLALEDNDANRHIVMQNKNEVQTNVEVYFVGATGVTEFQALLVEDCEDGFF